MNNFKCQTVAHFKIGTWLAEQGIDREDITHAEALGLDTVKIIGHSGQYMIIRWWDNDTPEIKEGV